MTHSDIIERKGTTAFAEALSISPAHVRVWKSRRIPRAAYADIITVFPDISLDDLKAGEPKGEAA
jgi:hypothetical protein